MTNILSLILAGLSIAYATGWLEGYDPYQFTLSAAAIAMAALLTFFATKPQDRARPIPRWAAIPLALIPLYLALQIVPLPMTLLSHLSPRSAEVAGWLNLTAAPLSIAPNASTAFTFRILTAMAVFFLIRQLAWQSRWVALIPVMSIAVLEAILGLTQAASGLPVLGTFVNRNHYAFLLEISLPFAVMGGIALIKDSRETRNAISASALFAAALLLLLAITFSLSRGGFLAALLSLFVLAILNLQKRLRAGGFALLTVAFIGLFFLLPVTDLVLRFAEISADGSSATSGARQLVWKDSMPVIRDFPWFGTGLGGYETAVRRHQTTALMYTIGYAHNEYIQFLTELGLVGLALFVIPILWIFQVLVRNIEDPLAKACLAACVAILLHCVVEYNLQAPANLLTVAWVAGVCASLLPSQRVASRR